MTAIPHFEDRRDRGRFPGAIWVLAAMCLFLVIALRIATGAVTAEEDALATLASRAGEMRLYDELAFSRGPLVALYLQAVHALAGDVEPVLAVRAGVIMAWAVSGIVLWKTALRASGSPMMAFFCLAAVLANGYLLEGRGEAFLAASLCVAPLCVGYMLHRAAIGGRGRMRPAFGSGLAFGVALSVAPVLAVVYAALFLVALIYPRSEDPVVRVTRVALPSALGVMIGALPLALYWAADPIVVMASLVDPLLLRVTEPAAPGLRGLDPRDWLPALLLAIVVGLLGLARRPALPMQPSDGIPLLLACAVVAVLGFILGAGSFPEFANAALVSLAVAAAAWWPAVRSAALGRMTPVIFGATAAMAAVALLPLAAQAPRLADRMPALMEKAGFDSTTPGADERRAASFPERTWRHLTE